MKTIVTINAGSSSLKFSVWQHQRLVLRGQIEQIGGRARLTIGRTTSAVTAPTLTAAMAIVKTTLERRRLVPDVVAHRIVHGGAWFHRPTRLRPTVLKRLKTIIHLAPVHLPINLTGVAAAQRFWSRSQAWGVFDTALYVTIPHAAQSYALPAAVSRTFKIRKYGFHGTSHAWAFEQAAKRLQHSSRSMNAVTLHLGAGSSVTLWKDGRAIDTSMGFTPLSGVVMMTRTGDIDPMIPLYLQTRGGWSATQVMTMLNHQSGVLGLTGLRDMRDVLQAAGHPVSGWPRRHWSRAQRQRARLGLAVYIYSLQRYLSSYSGLVSRLDAIVFTGGIGQNRTIQRLILAGVRRASNRRVVSIPTDEEQAIAQAVRRMVQ